MSFRSEARNPCTLEYPTTFLRRIFVAKSLAAAGMSDAVANGASRRRRCIRVLPNAHQSATQSPIGCAPFPRDGTRPIARSRGSEPNGESDDFEGKFSDGCHEPCTPPKAGWPIWCSKTVDASSRAYREPFGVNLYMCRGGLPVSATSQRVSSSLFSASLMRIGYIVPDFKPVLRLMSYPYFHSSGAFKKLPSTRPVCGDLRNLMQ